MYCPLPLNKVKELACSAWLMPFAGEQDNFFWKGNSAIFFNRPYKLNSEEPGLWLVADIEFLTSHASITIAITGVEDGKGYVFQNGTPVIPKMMHLCTDCPEMREKLIEQLDEADLLGKWPDIFLKEFVQQEELLAIIWNTDALAVGQSDLQPIIQDRSLGVILAYLVSQLDSYKMDDRYWRQFLEYLQKLRENKKLWTEENGTALQEAKRVLLKATGHKSDSFLQTMIQEKVLQHGLEKQEGQIHDFLKSIFGGTDHKVSLTEYISNLIYKYLTPQSRHPISMAVMEWMAKRSESDPWTLFARLQKQPHEPELYVKLNNHSKAQERTESRLLIEEAILLRDELFSIVPDKTDSTFVRSVIESLVNDTDNITGVDLLRTGVTAQHRQDIILRVLNACHDNQAEPEVIQSIKSIMKDSEKSFLKYNLSSPNFGIEVNSFLVFLMSPLDEKRIREQCLKWKADEKLAYLFHAALLGYHYLAGVRFKPLWEAVCSNELLRNKMALFLLNTGNYIKNINHTYSKEEDFQVHRVGEDTAKVEQMPLQNNPPSVVLDFGSETEQNFLYMESKILTIIRESDNGATFYNLRKKSKLPDDVIDKELGELIKNKQVIRHEEKGKVVRWKLNSSL